MTYDTAGNRLTRTLNTESDTYAYDSVTGRLQSVSGTNATTLTYDASGRTTGLGSLTLTYNDRGRLGQVSNTQGTLVKSTYNALEQRVVKTAASVITVFLYNRQGRLITESAAIDAIIGEYFQFIDKHRCSRHLGPLFVPRRNSPKGPVGLLPTG